MAEKNYQINQLQDDGSLLVLHPETTADLVVETTNNKVMTAAERTKLSGIESGAQANKLEGVQLNGTDLTITNKKVNIVVDTSDKINVSEKGVANGVATLGSDAKIPLSQIPDVIIGQMTFGGIATVENGVVSHIEVSSNAVSLGISSSASATDIDTLYKNNPQKYAGIYFIISGTINNATLTFGASTITNVTTGDWIVLLGTVTSSAAPYGKVDNTDAVTSVAGRTGAITLTKADVGLSNVTNESKETMFTSPAFSGTPTAPNPAAGTSSNQVATAYFVQNAVSTGTASKANQLATARTIALSGDATGSTTFDGSADKTITVTLASVGTAGTYSVVTTDAKGRVTKGAQVMEVGATGQTVPSSTLAIGGLFFKEI